MRKQKGRGKGAFSDVGAIKVSPYIKKEKYHAF
jgi:hypothetical protein